ncbi:MAG: uroporphyrinogen-III synthase [Bacteroidota bacterium]
MSAESRPRVLLLRSRDEHPPDRYEAALSAIGLVATTRPLLRFHFVNQNLIDAAMQERGKSAWVFTSPRAVKAFALVSERNGCRAGPETLAYAVGDTTRKAAARLGFQVVGAESGNAAALADLIVQHSAGQGKPPLVFLCGDRRLEVLPKRLRAAGLALHEITAYRTEARPPDIAPGDFNAAAWFSPSGVTAVFAEASPAELARWNSLKHAAIGPTTAAALAAVGVPPHVTAAAPTPAALAAAMASLFPSTRLHV